MPVDAPITPERVELGRYSFYDTRLSGNGTQSCAACSCRCSAPIRRPASNAIVRAWRFLYFFHHRRSLVNQAELSASFTTGIEHDVLAGWDYQFYPNLTDRRGGANFNTTPIDLFNPVDTHATRRREARCSRATRPGGRPGTR